MMDEKGNGERKGAIPSARITTLLRFFFKLLYHQLAWTYDLVAAIVSVGLWKEWVLSVIPRLDGPSIMELGYGTGHLQCALNEKGSIIYGIDASKQMARIAYRRIKDHDHYPRLAIGVSQYLPFPANAFHQVVSTFPSEFIFNRLTIDEVWRVLKPGGQFVILPTAWFRGKRFLERIAAWLFRITRQSEFWENRFIIPIRDAGFQPKVERCSVKNSELVIITARKENRTEKYHDQSLASEVRLRQEDFKCSCVNFLKKIGAHTDGTSSRSFKGK